MEVKTFTLLLTKLVGNHGCGFCPKGFTVQTSPLQPLDAQIKKR